MSWHVKRKTTDLAVRALVAAALSAAAPQAFAQRASDGPFADLSGYWSGGGTISMSNGSSERIRCKATYAVNNTGKSLNQSIRCASDSYKLDISANVTVSGGAVSGSWSEATRHATGALSGRASSSEISAQVNGAGFAAGLQVRFQGNRQTVSIRPTQGTDVSSVSISLRKG